MNDDIKSTNGISYAVVCSSRTAYEINIDTVFNSAVDFGIFKDDSCGMHNIKISGVLKVHTTAEGCMISGLVSRLSGKINNITSSLIITHTGSYLNRCSHIASNTIATTGEDFLLISNITLTGSMSVTGSGDLNDISLQRNIGGIIARAYSCKVNISGVAINGYSISHSQVLRGVAFLIGQVYGATINAREIVVIPFNDITGYINVNIDGIDSVAGNCSDDISKLKLKDSFRV